MIDLNKRQKFFFHLFGAACFFILICFALIFFRERMLQSDSAFYSFYIIQFKRFMVDHGRLCNYLTQALPILAIKADLPVIIIVMAYSVSFILLSYFFFLIVTIFFRDYTSGFAVFLSAVLVVVTIFYLPVSEFYQGIPLAILLWAYLNRYPDHFKIKWLWYLFPFICIALTFMFHPINVFCIAFVILLFPLIHKNSWLKSLGMILIVAVVVFFRYKILPLDVYETGKIKSLGNMLNYLGEFTNTKSYDYITSFLFKHKPLLIAIILFLGISIRNKNFILLSYSLLYSILYSIFIILNLPPSESPFVLENYYSAIGLFIALPLCISLRTYRFNWQLIICSILFLIASYKVYKSHHIISERIHFISRLNDYGKKFPERRYLLNHENYPWIYGWSTYGLPFETILMQAIDDPCNPLTFTVESTPGQFDSLRTNPGYFLGPVWDLRMFEHPDNFLRSDIFELPKMGYRYVNTLQDEIVFKEKIFSKENIEFITDKDVYTYKQDSFMVVPLTIINKSNEILRSVHDHYKVQLSYHLYNEKSELIRWDGWRTRFNVDIHDSFTQGLVISYPGKGKFIVEADIVTEGLRWWGINKRFNIEVND